MAHCLALIRVRVPDRPGALGLVASRIGALRGDIVGIEVLDRSDGAALDELAVVLPDANVIPAVEREIAEVDGTVTESVTIVDALPEPRLDAYRTATALFRAPTADDRFLILVTATRTAIRAEWCVVIDTEQVRVSTPDCPADPLSTASFVQPIGESGIILAVGLGTTLRAGELELVRVLCELTDAASRP
jgi:hypothetical protein